MTLMWEPSEEDEHIQTATSIGVDVDEGIAPLLEAVWKYGIDTDYSCQGRPELHSIMSSAGRSYVSFCKLDDAITFFRLTIERLEGDAGEDVALQAMTERRGLVTFNPERLAAITAAWQSLVVSEYR